MPDLLKNSPYAGFDPDKDPYISRYQDRADVEYNADANFMADVARHFNTTARNVLSLSLGLPGDLQSFLHKDIERLRRQGNAGLTSEDIAARIGGDPEHPSWLPASFVAPGPGELKGATAMLKSLAGEAAQHMPEVAMTLFHGTPHRFDRFALEKIGTGEGAQAYGHGLYFAENKKVAGQYQKALAGPFGDAYDHKPVIKALPGYAQSRDNSRAIISHIDEAMRNGDIKHASEYLDNFEVHKDFEPAYKKAAEAYHNRGHLYEVDIPDETIGKMLDWDAPLSEQPEQLKKMVDAGVLRPAPEPFADRFVDASGTMVNPADKAGDIVTSNLHRPEFSQSLKQAGIPGIRFFDAQSRKTGPTYSVTFADGKKQGFSSKEQAKQHAEAFGGTVERIKDEGTRNIVVFDPNDIREVKRDGEVVYKAQTKLEKAIELVDKY